MDPDLSAFFKPLSRRKGPKRVIYLKPVRRLLPILALSLLAGCAENTATICGGLPIPVTPEAPRVGDFPKISNLTPFPVAGLRSPEADVRMGTTLLAPAGCDLYWSATVDLPVEGPNLITLISEGSNGNRSPATTFTVVRDTTPPGLVGLAPLAATTADGVFTVSGSRELDTEVRLNGFPLVAADSAPGLSFSADVALAPGTTDLIFTLVDRAGNVGGPVTHTVTRTSAATIAPRLNFPLHRQTVKGPSVLLIWNQVVDANAVRYRVQVATGPGFDAAERLLDQTTASVLILSLNFTGGDGTYWWRVASEDAAGTVTYGVARSFNLGPVPGDVNGDGLADILAGAPGDDGPNPSVTQDNRGRVALFYGRPGLGDTGFETAAKGFMGPDQRGEMGLSVSAGDVNGDGFADLIAGAYRADTHFRDAGKAHLFLGGADPDETLDMTLEGQNFDDGFGLVVASGFDLNGDGVHDFAASAWQYDLPGQPNEDDRGRVYVFFGGNALNGGPDGVPDLILTGTEPGELLGMGLSGGVDYNADGHDDLVVGAPFADAPGGLTDAGRVLVYFGGPNVDGVADVELMGTFIDERSGGAVAGVGDLDGDGLEELAVGAPNYSPGGNLSTGRVLLFHGGPVPDTAPFDFLIGATLGEAFGISVTGHGDLNGDGLSDLAVGVPFSDVGGGGDPLLGDLGMVEIHLGADPIDTDFDFRFTGNNRNDQLGHGLHMVQDANGDGFHDLGMGAPNNDEGSNTFGDTGRAYVLFGRTIGWDPEQAVAAIDGDPVTYPSPIPGAILNNDGDKDGMGGALY